MGSETPSDRRKTPAGRPPQRSDDRACIDGFVTYRPLHHPTQSRVDLCCIYRADDDSQILRALLASMRQSVARLDLP